MQNGKLRVLEVNFTDNLFRLLQGSSGLEFANTRCMQVGLHAGHDMCCDCQSGMGEVNSLQTGVSR